jgi:RHS repeat-associated protein
MRNLDYLRTFVKSFLLPAFVYSALTVCAFSQSVTDGTTPSALTPGAPAGSYALSGLDDVSLYNGNLHFGLPLASVGGRGGVQVPISLFIEKHWRVEHAPNPYHTDDLPIDYATYTDWLYRPYFEPGRIEIRTMGHVNADCANEHEFWDPAAFTETLTRITFTAADGTEYELRDQATGGHVAGNGPCHFADSYRYRGTVFNSTDGSGITFIADSQVVDDPFGNTDLSGGYLLFRDGTRYRFDGGHVTWIRDRNGNLTTFTYGTDPNNVDTWGRLITIKDSLNRQVTFEYNVNDSAPYGLCDRILFKGFGGAATRVIRISRTSLSNVLRTTQAGDSATPKTSIQLFPSLNGSSSSSTPFDPADLVSAVWLPNGQSYNFRYNVYAELARVELPTGGAVEFDYGAGIAGDDSEGGVHYMFGTGYYEIYRRVLERRVYKDANTLEGKTTFSRPVVDQTATQSDVARTHVDSVSMDPNGTVLAKSRHFFYDSALDSLNQSFSNTLIGYYPNSWKSGKEYKTDALSTDGNDTTLRREEKNFQQRAHISWWPTNMSSQYEPANDPRVAGSTMTVEPTGANLVASQTYGYDDSVPFNNQNDLKQYDFGNGSAGPLLRETQTSYVTATNYTNTDVSLRSLPAQASVFDGNGIERARTTFEYDNYTIDTSHAALKDWSAITGLPMSGHDASFTSGYSTRGNATSTTRYLLTNGSVVGSISAYGQYDLAGNIVKTIDARGNATTFGFGDCFGAPDGEALTNSAATELAGQSSYAFATSVTNAMGQTSYAQFDYYTGRPVDGQDANGVISSGYSDNEPLDRPTKVIRGFNQGTSVKSQTLFSYDDTNRIVTVTSDQNSFTDGVLKNQTVFDGLGRTTEKRQYENATDYITVRQTYDGLGRSYQTSNPFRAGEANLWTTTGYDALSRVISVTTPDSAVVTTAYSGNTVTVSDQTSKQRKSVSDGLGRLIQVYEAPNDSNYNYLTSYSYDTLDDLTTVSQGSQTRSFVYDSLKRLALATNPESGTISYSYDNNGNLLGKTDARSITTNFAYDALNRATSRSYQNDPNGTPPASYFYDGQIMPSNAPTFTRGYSTGRLVAMTYGAGSAGDYYGYDAVGRSVLKIQQTSGVNYQTTATYSVSELTSETYPSGHAVSYNYDQAGRLGDKDATHLAFTGNLGDGTQRTYSTGIIYSSLGGMAKEQFGTNTPIYNKLFYNSRGQLSEIRESTTSPTDTTWDRGAIINNYSLQAGCVGASCSATDNNGNLMRQDVYIPGSSVFTQFYGYDSLNRLQSVHEDGPPGPANWQQAYTYDQYGNRKMNSAATWGNGINSMQAAVDPNTTTNRMYAPGETDQNHSLINYDNAGNQTKDYYSDSGNGEGYDRTYDAENRMNSATDSSNQTSSYTYDGAGHRVKRSSNGTETWQVYGLGGELLAEYAPNASPSIPQKEYGYRNGQLLITATAPSALAANTTSDKKPEAVAAASPASGKESTAAAQSFDLLASIKGLVLRLPGTSTVSSASTEAISDTSTPLYGPSFPYAGSLNRSALPLMPQSGSAKIAFASNRDGSAQIYSMNADGSGLSRLTNDAANDEVPNWSPNNSRIVFQSDRDNLFSGIADIYVMNWDGSGQTRLTSDAADDSAPVWSPDGTKIAFQSARNGASYQVYMMNADGSGQVNITNSAANDNQPSWSPDGSKIAFASDRDQAGFSSIYVMNANGTSQTRLTTSGTGVLDQQPAWSPDGTKLTFTSTRDSIVQTWQETDDNGGIVTKSALNVNKEVYLMNADGSAQVRLTNTLENDDSASWSGDGTKIVFRSDRERDCCDPTEQVWLMNPDGTSQMDLSNNGLDEHCPSWQHVAANMPPTVSLTSPANGASFIAPANITLTANASDSDGSVTRVDFYQGVTLIGTATTSPYTITWNNVAAGSYSLTARATDNLGATTTSAAVTITVNANAPPAVSITSPATGAVFTAPANITVTANASDSDGSVSRVDFYQGTTPIGTSTTSPYTINWNNVAGGSYSLTARATDNLGATTTSAPVNITVNAPPTVSITSPTSGASFTAPANVTITANASDSDGSISRVDFYQGTTLIGTATTSPFTISWNNVVAGGYTITARATDNLGASTTSNPISITVGSPPTVSVTTPTNGTGFTAMANVTINANASASNGSINRVEFYQGTTLVGTTSVSPYTISWNNVAAGGYTLKARAIDNSGASTDSTPVNISVNAPPAVSVTSPTSGASFTAPASISITANATDSDGTISRVDFYQGTTLIGTATASPYNISWNNVTTGTYSVTAKATDNVGAQTNSNAVNITVITTVADVRWIVTDQLGTPRMIFDQTGSLANVSRHDYLPFGEELFAGTGGRTPQQGYGAGDGVRQHFTGYERDNESGLDYAHARYYASMQGRFASPDPYVIMFEMKRGQDAEEEQEMLLEYLMQPQNWAKYNYGLNNPLNHTDPTGMRPPTRNEQNALNSLDQMADKEGDTELGRGLRAARNEIAHIIDGLGRGQQDVGVNVAVNAVLNIGNQSYADSATVSIRDNNGAGITIGPSNKCNILVAETYVKGAGLNWLKNGRGYPMVNGAAPAANWLGDARDRQHLANIAIVQGSLRPGDIVAWRYTGGTKDGHSSIYIGGGVLVYAGSYDTGGVPKAQTLNYVSNKLEGYWGGHDTHVVRRYNGKP